MKSEHKSQQANRKVKRDRYWSVMLVGDHGRIIPFRRLKGLLISGICLLVLSLVALGVLGMLYVRQNQLLAGLQDELSAAKQQAAELRDEKDLYLTQLTVKKEQQSTPAKKRRATRRNDPAPAPAVKPPAPAAEKSAPKAKPAAAKPKKPAPVKWAADIRRFKVTYNPAQKVLKAEFRIYNISKPKKALSGRTVVVFKNLDDTPIHWLPVPRVQMSNGEPSGSRGQSFKINNYRTEKFRAYGQKAPVKYNAATVYIYTKKGQLLVSKEFGFNIAYKPPPKPAAPKPPPKPVVASPPAAEPTPAAKPGGVVTPAQAPPATAPIPEMPAAVDAPPVPGGPRTETPDAGDSNSTRTAPAVPEVDTTPSATPSPNVAPPAAETPPAETPMVDIPAADTPSVTPPAEGTPPADKPETELNPQNQGEQQ